MGSKLRLLSRSICTPEGFHIDGTKPYQRYYGFDAHPSVYDAFLDESTLVIVLETQFARGGDSEKGVELARRFTSEDWLCRLGSKELINNSFHEIDPQHHSHVLKFEIDNLSDVISAKFRATIFTSGKDIAVRYDDVPFCVLPPRPAEESEKIFAALCTQNLIVDVERIVDWVAWHNANGFEYGLLYINDNSFKGLKEEVDRFIDHRWLTLVDWKWPKAWAFHDQPISQTSCLHRMKGRAKWLGVNDIDELFIAGNGTVRDVLERYEPRRRDMGALAACNRWMQGLDGRIGNLNRCATECVPHPKRQKCILNVEAVDYFCIHQVMNGKPEVPANESELVNGHTRIRGNPVMRECDDVSKRMKAMLDAKKLISPM